MTDNTLKVHHDSTPRSHASAAQQARMEFVAVAAAELRGSGTASIFTTKEPRLPITEVSDVVYLADYMERGQDCYWLGTPKD